MTMKTTMYIDVETLKHNAQNLQKQINDIIDFVDNPQNINTQKLSMVQVNNQIIGMQTALANIFRRQIG